MRPALLPAEFFHETFTVAEPANSRKKKPLTEIEIALKREETARKRRNLTEKKLEDEKVRRVPPIHILPELTTAT